MCQSLQKPIYRMSVWIWLERGAERSRSSCRAYRGNTTVGDTRMSSALSENRSCTLTEGIGLMGTA